MCLLSGLIHRTEVRGRDGLDPTLLAPPPLDLPPARGRARRALALATHSLKHIQLLIMILNGRARATTIKREDLQNERSFV